MKTTETVKATILETARTAYNYGFDILNTVQEQGEKTFNAALDNAPWINAEGREAIDAWVGFVKNAQTNAKTVLDENFKTFEKLLAG